MRLKEWTAAWYRALIRNARADSGELERIRVFIEASSGPPDGERRPLLRLIEKYLPGAGPARPPRDEAEAALWADPTVAIHDTTAYDQDEQELIFITRRHR